MHSGDILISPKGQYEIDRRLGNGAFGIVYLSNYTPANSTTSMQVAVKEIARNYNNRETCKKEEELLKTISTSFTSEHVVKYIDSFADGDITVPSKIHSLSLFSLTTKYMLPNEDGKLFITMEFCSGGDLASKINEKIESGSEFDKETIFAYMSQIVDGYSFAQSNAGQRSVWKIDYSKYLLSQSDR
ncbi:hypothetical protein WR25_12666 [Diploscapter pachys]|uniref:Protein kinase domain-containing protein n=1 Tax=Diploscapter pachys TaxID=2018661 RepID=A0A2A2KQB9_9BILA|nr:hypothetical protein WR25_12666 [Diploscapter pachys]